MNPNDGMTETLLATLAIISAGYWLAIAVGVGRVILGVPVLARLAPREPERWPKVSVIIPACNEEQTLEAALRSRLAEGYPNAEYLVIDDRSTDRTPEIIERLAQEDPRIIAVHVDQLPDGWLGKVHAMHVGLGRTTGEWILLSDADVHHEPGTLRRIVAQCEEHGVDHVSVFPSIFSSTFGLDVVMNTLLRMLVVGSRAWKVADPRSRVSVGGGNFNLVRRTVLDRAGGLEPLKMEVIDDAALGQMVKWSGAKQRVFNARGFVGLSFYSNVRDAVLGMEKNAFAMIGRFSALRFTWMIAALAVLELGGIAALVAGGGWIRALAGGALAVSLAAHVVIARWLGRPVLPSAFAPLGMLVFLFGAVRSMLLTLVRSGISWRGTHYSLAALRRGRRFLHV